MGLYKRQNDEENSIRSGSSENRLSRFAASLIGFSVLYGTVASGSEAVAHRTGASQTIAHTQVVAPKKRKRKGFLKATDVEKSGASLKAGGKTPHGSARPLSPAALDPLLHVKGWDIPFPSYGDSLLLDYGGWRSTLAKYGIGLIAYTSSLGAVNTLNTPLTNSRGAQVYWGQRGSLASSSYAFLTYDLTQYGIPDGQISASGAFVRSTWEPFASSTVSLNRAVYYQTLFDRKVELQFGYIGTTIAFAGNTVGGNIASPFGPSASVLTELGMSTGPQVAPAAILKYNFTDKLYNEFGIQRSAAPTSNPYYSDNLWNPGAYRFSEPYAKALFINEIGFQQASTAEQPYTWARLGGIYNTSSYENYATTPVALQSNFYASNKSTTKGLYFLGDRQIWRKDASSDDSAYRGIYVGVSGMYAPPETSIFSQYYEARVYSSGLFDSRPLDQIQVVYSHNVISHFYADSVDSVSTTTGTSGRHAVNSITTSYTAHLAHGLYLTAGVAFTDHPVTAYQPNTGSALNFLYSLFVVW